MIVAPFFNRQINATIGLNQQLRRSVNRLANVSLALVASVFLFSTPLVMAQTTTVTTPDETTVTTPAVDPTLTPSTSTDVTTGASSDSGFSVTSSPTGQATCTVNGQTVSCDEAVKTAKNFIGWGIGVILAILIIGLLGTIFWIMMIVHAASQPIDGKVAWIVILLLTHLLGAIIYYFVIKRPFDDKKSPRTPLPPLPESK